MELHERISRPFGTTGEAHDPFSELKNRLHLALINDVRPADLRRGRRSDLASSAGRGPISGTACRQRPVLSRDDRERLLSEIADDVLGYGPARAAARRRHRFRDHGQRPREDLGRAAGSSLRDGAPVQRRLAPAPNHQQDGRAGSGRRIDESSPMVDARLPDGSRVNAVIPPLSLSGPLITIRKFHQKRFTLDELIRIGTLSAESVDFLRRCIEAQLNILISGGTGTGKTTLLNALSAAPTRLGADRDDRGCGGAPV